MMEEMSGVADERERLEAGAKRQQEVVDRITKQTAEASRLRSLGAAAERGNLPEFERGLAEAREAAEQKIKEIDRLEQSGGRFVKPGEADEARNAVREGLSQRENELRDANVRKLEERAAKQAEDAERKRRIAIENELFEMRQRVDLLRAEKQGARADAAERELRTRERIFGIEQREGLSAEQKKRLIQNELRISALGADKTENVRVFGGGFIRSAELAAREFSGASSAGIAGMAQRIVSGVNAASSRVVAAIKDPVVLTLQEASA
jgi:hypothetical protein